MAPCVQSATGVELAGKPFHACRAPTSLTLAALRAQVAPFHFRLLFVHLATGLPAMHLYANDDVLLTTVEPGATATLDHIRVAPHAPGKIVKLQFVSADGATTAAQSFDLSTRCDTSAYALLFSGTAGHDAGPKGALLPR